MCCILERAAQDFYSSPYRLTDKPVGYGPTIRGSNPREEAILSKGGIDMKPKIKYWQTIKELEKGWITPAVSPYSCPYQHYEKEADFDDLHRDTLIQEMIEKKYIICGDTHQYQAIPIFNDGYLLLSMRKWAEIMKEVYEICNPNEEELPNFYMACLCSVEEKLPRQKEGHDGRI